MQEPTREELVEALRDCGAHLAGALSLLDAAPATVAPSKRMFIQMKRDYRASLERTRVVLRKLPR